MKPTPGVLTVCLLFSSLLVGCASDQASRYYLNERLASRPVDQVTILRSPPSRPYEVIADFQSRGETAQDMQKHAPEVGADAVVVVIAGGARGLNEQWADRDAYAHTYTRIMGTAIRYKEKN